MSLDTFRPTTLLKCLNGLANGYAADCLQRREGVIATEQVKVDTLGEKFFYVLCHNRVPSREETPLHMNYQIGAPETSLMKCSYFS